MPDADTAPKAKTEKVPVTMEDGSTVEFNKKQKLVKTSTISEDGSIALRLDFVSGAVRNFSLPAGSPLYSRFAAHGAEQKLGDAIAGESDPADAVLAVDDLITRLNAGDWTVQRAAGSFSGTSILIQALVEVSGKSVDDIKAFLADKSQAEKLALRRSDRLKPTIERLESEKASKSKNAVDTDALLGDLGIGDGAKATKKPKGE
jgi:hypothetical protein